MLFLSSFFLSLFLYVGLIVGIFFYTKEIILKHKVYVKKEALEVTVVEEPKKEVVKPKSEDLQKVEEKKDEPIIEKQKENVVQKIEKREVPDIDELFSSIDTKKFKNKKPKEKKKQASFLNSRDYKRDENRTIPKLEIEVQKKADQKQNVGEVNEYLANVTDILTSRWTQTVDSTKGSLAIVKITIDIYGAFSYSIKEYSKSSIFNKKLTEFLEQQAKNKFDKPKEKFFFNIKFKDE